MTKYTRHRHSFFWHDIARFCGAILSIFDKILAPIMDLIRRVTLAQAFFVSGLLKLGNWQTALFLSEHEYPVSWLDPVTAAYLGVGVEIIAPVLLVLGLGTRLAALALMVLTIITQIVYQPVNSQVFWIIIFAYWFLAGAGRFSMDHALRGLKDSALPLSDVFTNIFNFLKKTVAPFYLLLMRVWIAAILYAAGHTAMQSMGLLGHLQFLDYHPSYSVLRMAQDQFWVDLICGFGALCLAVGFATRIFAFICFVVLGLVTMHIDASAVQASEFVYWGMLLSILVFNGPGQYSIDRLLRRFLTARFPVFDGEMPMVGDAMPHVVIIGAGFGGIAAARALRTTACRVTLIDKHNYHLFQPLLYQVATAGLSPSDIATPIRGLFRDQQNIRVMLGEVTGIEKSKKIVQTANGKNIPYDYLIVATGARHSYFGKDQWAEFAPGIKRVEDAVALRGKLLRAFEAAENADDPDLQRRLLSFVIVGGGPTGVEMAGALAELAYQGMQDEFRRIDPRRAQIYLVEAGARLLAVMPESISAYTKQSLENLGVKVLTGGRVDTIDAEGVVISGQRIDAKNVIWAAGVQASPAAAWLSGESDRAGRLKVNVDLRLPGDENIYAIGDTVLADVWNGKPMPGLAPAAKQSGQFAAGHIRDRIEGRVPKKSFHYRHYGSLATIGRKSAVADFGRFRMRGVLAWWFWGFVHVAFLANMQSRVAVLVEWFWAYLTYRRSIRLITDPPSTKSG